MLNELLPKWYRPVTLSNFNDETFRKRITDIKKIVKAKTIEWFYDCIRIYLGKPVENNSTIDELKKMFGKSDPFFHQNDSSLELQILSGAIIYEAVLGSPNNEHYKLALITFTAVFITSDKIINDDILEKIHTYLTSEGDFIRNRDLVRPTDIPTNLNWEVTEATTPFLTTKFKEFFLEINQRNKQLIQEIETAYTTINLLREESNLLWWTFGSFSDQQLRSDIDKYSFPFIIGGELANLVKTIPPAQVTWQFLKKAISEAKHDLVNEPFSHYINLINESLCTTFASDYNTKLSNLLPIHFALYKRKESGEDKAWITGFESKCLIKADTEVSIFDFTRQFITELLILKVK